MNRTRMAKKGYSDGRNEFCYLIVFYYNEQTCNYRLWE